MLAIIFILMKIFAMYLTKRISCAVFIILFLINAITAYALKPIKSYQTTPAGYGIDYLENKIPSGKAIINSWLLLQKDTSVKKTFIICHHDYGNMSFALPLASEMYQRGYNVVCLITGDLGAAALLRWIAISCFILSSSRIF
jgi:hypothetical protein